MSTPVATTPVATTPVATKKDVVKEEKPVLNIGALTGIIIFYVINYYFNLYWIHLRKRKFSNSSWDIGWFLFVNYTVYSSLGTGGTEDSRCLLLNMIFLYYTFVI